MSERALHTAVVQFLNLALPAEAVLHHSMNEGRRGWKAQRDVKALGMRKGWPDLEILYGGKAYFLELKQPGNKPTPAQQDTHQAIRRAGCECFVAHDLDEVILACDFWAIPLRAHMTTGNMTVMAMVS